jgi:hypothetical protein
MSNQPRRCHAIALLVFPLALGGLPATSMPFRHRARSQPPHRQPAPTTSSSSRTAGWCAAPRRLGDRVDRCDRRDPALRLGRAHQHRAGRHPDRGLGRRRARGRPRQTRRAAPAHRADPPRPRPGRRSVPDGRALDRPHGATPSPMRGRGAELLVGRRRRAVGPRGATVPKAHGRWTGRGSVGRRRRAARCDGAEGPGQEGVRLHPCTRLRWVPTRSHVHGAHADVHTTPGRHPRPGRAAPTVHGARRARDSSGRHPRPRRWRPACTRLQWTPLPSTAVVRARDSSGRRLRPRRSRVHVTAAARGPSP